MEGSASALPRIRYQRSPEAEEAVRRLVDALNLSHIRVDRVYVAVSRGSRTSALARIWGIPAPFTRLGVCEPAYVIELVHENLRGADCEELVAVVVHELLHIPRGFSGGLRAHGEWSRWGNIMRLVRGLPEDVRRDTCRLLRRALEAAPG